MIMKKKYIISIIMIIILMFFDYLTKTLIINSFEVNDSMILIKDFLKFYYIKNYGASFGMLSGQTILLVIFTVVAIIYLFGEIKKSKSLLLIFSSSLIIGGALGNLIDRVFRGYVIDFISFTLFGSEMPIFNLADIFISFGVIIYLYIVLMEGKYERNNNRRRK